MPSLFEIESNDKKIQVTCKSTLSSSLKQIITIVVTTIVVARIRLIPFFSFSLL